MRWIRAALNNRTALVVGLFSILGLLLIGIAHFGMVNSLPPEQHVERNHDGNNRLIITEDKDGCLDMRTLGRSNGVYMSIKPCKPGDKDKPPPPPATPQKSPN